MTLRGFSALRYSNYYVIEDLGTLFGSNIMILAFNSDNICYYISFGKLRLFPFFLLFLSSLFNLFCFSVDIDLIL